MPTKKSIFQSKTIWGIVILLIGAVTIYLHIPSPVGDNPDAQQLADLATKIKAAHGLWNIVGVITGSIGTLLAIYGRIVANSNVTITGK